MKIRFKESFAGEIGGCDCPQPGSEADVPDALGKALCADGRAEEVEAPKPKRGRPRKEAVETAVTR